MTRIGRDGELRTGSGGHIARGRIGLGTELIILGGGPAGVAVAYYANQAQRSFALFERSSVLGGLCRTLTCGSHRYDTGAHRFHDRDPEITRDLRLLLGPRLKTIHRPSQVFVGGRFVSFPPTPLGVIFSSRWNEIHRIGLDLVKTRRRRGEVVTFADFAVQSFGKTLAERFLLNYSAKVWGLPAELLSPAVATRRLAGMTLRTLLTEILSPRRKTDHLDGSFLYPEGGYGRIIEALAGTLPVPAVHTGHEVSGLSLSQGRVTAVHFANGLPDRPVDGLLVSTLPLTFLARLLGPKVLSEGIVRMSETLLFRSVRLIFLRLNLPRFSSRASIYIPDPEYCISRLSEPKNRCETMAPPSESGLVVEVPCFPDDVLGRLSDRELKDRVVEELRTLRLLDPDLILDWRHRLLPNAYPVYSLDYADKVRSLLEAIRGVGNLVTLGRNGQFHYSHLHDQLRIAKDFVVGGTLSAEALA
jgi:protoporphyrinogen oxidase